MHTRNEVGQSHAKCEKPEEVDGTRRLERREDVNVRRHEIGRTACKEAETRKGRKILIKEEGGNEARGL